MWKPSFDMVEREGPLNRCGGVWQTTPPPYHPHLRKYYWWVFHRGSPCEGPEFLTKPYRLNGLEAHRLIDALRAAGETCCVYCDWIPRRHKLFDPDAARWKGMEWAPAIEDDPDPEYRGFK